MAGAGDTERVIEVPPQGLPAGPGEAAHYASLAADPRVARVLVPASLLQARVDGLAAAIARDLAAAPALTVLVVLKGAFCFAKDLGERLFAHGAPPVRYEFLKAVTYGAGIKGSGENARRVRLQLKPAGLRGRDVLLVEDLVDQAFTLSRLRALLEQEGLRSLRLCVLAEKVLAAPSPAVQKLREGLRPDYVGFRLPDVWIAGYGIDAGEDFRNLPCLVAVNEAHYRRG